MSKETGATRTAGLVSFAFNAAQPAAPEPSQGPWRRAELMARADAEFRRLRNLKPARALE